MVGFLFEFNLMFIRLSPDPLDVETVHFLLSDLRKEVLKRSLQEQPVVLKFYQRVETMYYIDSQAHRSSGTMVPSTLPETNGSSTRAFKSPEVQSSRGTVRFGTEAGLQAQLSKRNLKRCIQDHETGFSES